MLKKILPYKIFLFLLTIVFLIFAIVGLCHYSIEFLNLLRLNWIFVCISFILMMTPLTSMKINAKNTQAYRLPKYILLVFCFQLSLYVISIGFSRLLGQLFPVFTSPHPDVISNAAQFPFWQTGFFPWGFYSLWIAVICYFSFYFQKKSHRKINFFLKKITPLTRLGISLSAGISLSIASACFALQLCYFVLGIKPLMVTYGPNFLAFISILITIFLMTQKQLKSVFFHLSKHFSPGLTWLVFLLCFILSFIAINTLIIGSIHQKFTIPTWLIQWQQKNDWNTVCKVLIASWWITVTPVTALFIARISKGYSLRTTMLTIFVFPILISLIFKINMQWHIVSYKILSSSMNILTLLGSIVFIYFALISKKWARVLFRGDFPKILRLQNRNFFPILMKFKLTFFAIFYLILMYGIYIIVFPIFIAAALLLTIFLIISTIFLYVFTFDYYVKIKNKKSEF